MGLQRECGGRGTHPDEILGSQVASDEGTILETPRPGKVAAASSVTFRLTSPPVRLFTLPRNLAIVLEAKFCNDATMIFANKQVPLPS